MDEVQVEKDELNRVCGTHQLVTLVFAVVNNYVRAELFRIVLRRASDTNDKEAGLLGQLDCVRADRGRCAVDDDSLAKVGRCKIYMSISHPKLRRDNFI